MKLRTYLRSTATRSMSQRFGILLLIGILCLCTAMRCKKDNYIFEELQGLEDARVFVTLDPEKTVYAVGDIISISGVITPGDLEMSDFSSLAYFDLPSDYHLYHEDGEEVAHGAFSLPLGEQYRNEGFDTDKSKYTFKASFKLEKSGKYRLQKGKKALANRNDGTVFYSTLNVTVYSGVRKPKGYRTDIPMYFTNNDKTYFAINVE